MSWLERLIPSRISTKKDPSKKGIPEGIWTKCTECEAFFI